MSQAARSRGKGITDKRERNGHNVKVMGGTVALTWVDVPPKMKTPICLHVTWSTKVSPFYFTLDG